MEPRTDVPTLRRLGFLVGLFVYLGALWLLWDTRIIYPLKIFVVFLHEVSHGVAAVATGGSIAGIQISSDQGGVCQCGGGIRFVTLTAGYLGSLLWGVAMLLIVRAKRIWHWISNSIRSIALEIGRRGGYLPTAWLMMASSWRFETVMMKKKRGYANARTHQAV